ncbi:MAG: folylpolyglutamate synthase/dihydrofolate synthase family protein [Cyclobacteriaceae bacterium]
MEYGEVIRYLYDMLPMYQRIGNSAIKKDLKNTRKLCKALGHPQEKFKSVHVAGTNGKGSSSHMLASILARAGYKTGLYTSPHLKHFTERIKVNGQPVSESYIVEFVESVKPLIGQIKPSFFELTVAMAFDYFAREEVDIAVIEVGLGGRLDSTNVIMPEVSLITNISYDHQEMLGETLEEIAAEKGGIIKKKVPVVIGEKEKETSSVFTKLAGKRKSPLVFASDQFIMKSIGLGQKGHEIKIRDLESGKVLTYFLESPGLTQLKNIPGVLSVANILKDKGYNIPLEDVKYGIEHYQKSTGLKGRWQLLNMKPRVIADIAHNEAGLENITRQLAGLKKRKLYCILGFMKEKDVAQILPLFPKDAEYIFCQANVPRAMDAKWLALQAALYHIDGRIIPDVNTALKELLEKAGEEDVIFVGGSTFVVAELENL